MKASALHLAPLLFLALASGPSLALPSNPPSFRYQLGDEAAFESGCLPPCMCPVLVRSPLTGTLNLTPGGFDGVFQHYDVRDVDWQYVENGSPMNVAGSGHYRVAGDQQQLVLDLSVAGGPAQHFDSGLTAGGSSFPNLRVPVALHGFFCLDSVYGVQATAKVTGVIGPPESVVALRLGPNPFHSRAGIGFGLVNPGAVKLRIHDLAGREVRRLLEGVRLDSGPHTATWNGRRSDGTEAPAGIYFVRLESAGRELRGTLIKL